MTQENKKQHFQTKNPSTDAEDSVCPLTGEPPLRLIQTVRTYLLVDFWKYYHGVDVSRVFGSLDRLRLFEARSGIIYFHPLIAGDGRFYDELYRRIKAHRMLERDIMARNDYLQAAKHVQPGMRVLDVGCGRGAFRQHLPHAIYQGIDAYAPKDADPTVARKSVETHEKEAPGAYDVVTAFHVLEHTADPRRFVESLCSLLKPGGLLILSVPLHPSPMTEIPNFLINAPPHHLTWWTPKAFQTLCELSGLTPLEICALPASPHQWWLHWIHRLSFGRSAQPPKERYFGHRWSWHLSNAMSYPLAWAASRFRTLPPGAKPVDLFLLARKS